MLPYIENNTQFAIYCFLVRGFEAIGAGAFSTASFIYVIHMFPDNVSAVLVSLLCSDTSLIFEGYNYIDCAKLRVYVIYLSSRLLQYCMNTKIQLPHIIRNPILLRKLMGVIWNQFLWLGEFGHGNQYVRWPHTLNHMILTPLSTYLPWT